MQKLVTVFVDALGQLFYSISVAMTAQYQVDVAGGWGYLGIINAIY